MNRKRIDIFTEPVDEEEDPTAEDLPFVKRRLGVLLLGFIVLSGILGAQVYRLTVLHGPEYRESSENNFRKSATLIAPRGRILDRNGEPLAINEPRFDIEMSPFGLRPEQILATGSELAALLGRPRAAELAAGVVKLRPRWRSRTVAKDIKLGEVLPVREQAYRLPGLILAPHYKRVYPSAEITGHITGHVGAIDKKRLTEYLERGYLRNEKIGMQGAESTFEKLLHGQHGAEIVVRDAEGRPRRRAVDRRATPGHHVYLTIDMKLQRLAHALLEGWKGTIIVMDPRDGAVLAMADRPTYDPNRPWRGSPYNKITRGHFAPGSTFKVVTAAAGLLGGRSAGEHRSCAGVFFIPGVRLRFPCHLRWGHGSVDLYGALERSCNVYFYNWSYRMRGRRMIKAAAAFGFGRRTDFELVGPGEESKGRLAHPDQKIRLGTVLHMGIGQGELIDVTPIQMARAYAALCNGGTLHRPRIIHEIRSPAGKLLRGGEVQAQGQLPLTDDQRRAILEGLWQVVHEKRGTGSRIGFKPEWRVAGKTGTAQTPRSFARLAPSNAWFCGFAPFEDPEVLVLVLVEEAGHGGAEAGPVARQIMAQYFGQPEPEIVPPEGEKKKTEG